MSKLTIFSKILIGLALFLSGSIMSILTTLTISDWAQILYAGLIEVTKLHEGSEPKKKNFHRDFLWKKGPKSGKSEKSKF